MAKKKEKIIINKGALSTTTVGIISNSKKSLIPLIFTMIIFVMAIVFMPEIVEYSKEYIDFSNGFPTFNFNGNTSGSDTNNQANSNNNQNTNNEGNNVNIPDNNGNDNTSVPEEQPSISKYEYAENLVINSNHFSLKNISINESDISFELTNTTDKEINLKNYNYFMEFYNGNVFVDRVILEKETVSAGASKLYFVPMTLNNVTHVSLVEIPQNDYSNFSVSEDENSRGSLTCTKDNETIIYNTYNQKTVSITDTIIGEFSDFGNYNQMANIYKGVDGYDSNVSIDNQNVVFKLTIELADASADSLSSKYYEYETKINVVRFEMKARGYSCN